MAAAAAVRAAELAVCWQGRGGRGCLEACCGLRARRGEPLPRQASSHGALAACFCAACGARWHLGQMQARQAPAAHTQARFAERMCGGSGATMRGCSSLRAFASCSRYRQLRDGLLWPASCMAQPCSPLWGRGKVCMARPCRHLRVLHKRTSCGSHQVSACISPAVTSQSASGLCSSAWPLSRVRKEWEPQV